MSDTALWMAAYRAAESERPDALFKDPFARRMAGPRGADIVGTLPFGRSMAWSIIVRTAVMDKAILRRIARGARTVVNLGAGLDARAFRLSLPPKLRWFDVDLPAMTAYRRECLGAEPAACQHAHVAADVSDAAERSDVLADARGGDGSLLVITEGLLVYLTPEQVTGLATQLHASQARWWLADLVTPLLQTTMAMVWQSQLADAGAPFLFAPQDSKLFFEPLGWHEKQFFSIWTESIRLKRTAPFGPAWDHLWRWSAPAAREAMQRMSGIALLARGPSTRAQSSKTETE